MRTLSLLVFTVLIGCEIEDTKDTQAATDADGDGVSVDDGDCDDDNAAVYPGAAEVCDGLDNNCDDAVDNDATDMSTWYLDNDGDGYGDDAATAEACEQPEGHASTGGDCLDSNGAINPDADELCDGLDNNCDDAVDNDAVDLGTWYLDSDGDGFGDDNDVVRSCQATSGRVGQGGDCDDANSRIYPKAAPACSGIDGDCDGTIDNDGDGDGYSDAACGGLDCDDADPKNYNECTPGLDPSSPGLDCADIIDQDPRVTDGVYWIDPDGDGDTSDSFEVYCDMTTDGGGWTLTYFVDAEHFDGEYLNNLTVNSAPPTAINDQSDIWNAEQEMSFTELLYACTTQGDKATWYWTYTDTTPHTWYTDTIGNYNYQTLSSASTNYTTAGGCFSTHNNSNYGFMVISASGCGSCSNIMYGMYHYPSSSGCNSTSTTYGDHSSPYDSRSITYPICGGQQTSDGMFWFGVR